MKIITPKRNKPITSRSTKQNNKLLSRQQQKSKTKRVVNNKIINTTARFNSTKNPTWVNNNPSLTRAPTAHENTHHHVTPDMTINNNYQNSPTSQQQTSRRLRTRNEAEHLSTDAQIQRLVNDSQHHQQQQQQKQQQQLNKSEREMELDRERLSRVPPRAEIAFPFNPNDSRSVSTREDFLDGILAGITPIHVDRLVQQVKDQQYARENADHNAHRTELQKQQQDRVQYKRGMSEGSNGRVVKLAEQVFGAQLYSDLPSHNSVRNKQIAVGLYANESYDPRTWGV